MLGRITSSTGSGWRAPTLDESGIFEMLTSASFPGRDMIREQLKNAQVSDLDSNGSLKFATSGPPAFVVSRVPVELSYPDSDGVIVYILLHVVGQFVDEVEMYREDGSSIQRGPSWTIVEVATNPESHWR
jgi:hypothetical protein